MKSNIFSILTLTAAVALTACTDSDDWTPGPADNAAGVRAYFENPTKTSFVFDSESDASEQVIEVALSRSETAEAISFPLNITSDTEGFTLLGPAEFAAGKSSTTVQVSCAGLSVGAKASVTLSVPEDQSYVYGIGLPSVSFTVIKASWKECADNVKYIYQYLAGNEMYPDTEGRMYHLEGTDRFKLTDFFGSGLDMEFNCSTAGFSKFTPLINCDFDSASGSDYAGLDCWYLFDDENQTWPVWTPGNISGCPSVQYVVFYGDTSYSSLNMISDEATLYGYIQLATDVTYDNGDFEWGTWYVTFNLKENLFK